MKWYEVKKQNDIEILMREYGWFHDSCIVGLEYKSSAQVDQARNMFFGTQEGRILKVQLQRQGDPISIELCFSGVRQFHIVGWHNNYSCDIFDAYLKIHNDLITGVDDNLVVWADNEEFNPKTIMQRNLLLDKPMDTFIIASSLKWKFN